MHAEERSYRDEAMADDQWSEWMDEADATEQGEGHVQTS